MSKEKQIEEMALELCYTRNVVKRLHNRKCGDCDIKSCDIHEICEDLYNAGYRKQSEGEWIFKGLDEFRKYKVTCPFCKAEYVGNYDAYDEPEDFNYCPNCGAKMKGGAE